jgi:predicted secreted protein
MNIASFAVVFICSWWIVIFMVLPFGVRRNEAPEEGHDPGAPIAHNLKKKMLITTAIATVLTALYWYLFDYLGITVIER